MKKAIFPALALAVLYGCASAPTEDKSIDASKPAAATPAPGTGAAAAPVAPTQLPGTPIQDPGLLSKRSVYYDFDRYDIKDEYRPVLQAHAKNLAASRGKKMLVQGNCDERGSREYNIALGQRRAESVKRTLLLMGAADSQIEAVSLGEEKPRCTEHDESCWSQNRRGDMLYGGEY